MNVRRSALYSVACLLAAAGTAPAMAEAADAATVADESSSNEAAAVAAPAPADTPANGWEFSATAYLWASGLKGDVGVFPALPTVSVDLSFADIFNNLDIAGMAVLQAQKGHFVAFADVMYISLSAKKQVRVRDLRVLSANLDQTLFTSTVAAGYRFTEEGPLLFDLFGGLRYTSVDTTLDFQFPNNAITAENKESWIDPIVGARVRVPISDRWAFTTYGDVGGFNMNSKITWQILGTLQYRISDRFSAMAGWRKYGIDYDKDGFVFDVTMDGPVMGVTFNF